MFHSLDLPNLEEAGATELANLQLALWYKRSEPQTLGRSTKETLRSLFGFNLLKEDGRRQRPDDPRSALLILKRLAMLTKAFENAEAHDFLKLYRSQGLNAVGAEWAWRHWRSPKSGEVQYWWIKRDLPALLEVRPATLGHVVAGLEQMGLVEVRCKARIDHGRSGNLVRITNEFFTFIDELAKKVAKARAKKRNDSRDRGQGARASTTGRTFAVNDLRPYCLDIPITLDINDLVLAQISYDDVLEPRDIDEISRVCDVRVRSLVRLLPNRSQETNKRSAGSSPFQKDLEIDLIEIGEECISIGHVSILYCADTRQWIEKIRALRNGDDGNSEALAKSVV